MKSPALALALAAAAHAEPMTARQEGGQIIVREGPREVLRYQAEPVLPRPGIPDAFRRGGYIAALRTPAGRLVTDDFPANHLHHHGVWSAWTKTEFQGRQPDFWNMGDGTGRVEFVAVDDLRSGPEEAGFRVRHRFVDLTVEPPVTVLLETWEVNVRKDGGAYRIDLISTQTCATDAPLDLPEYRYGGIGLRGAAAWDGAPNCRFLAASGGTDRVALNGRREEWCWTGAEVDGAVCGIYLFDHPENFRFPQPLRIHPTEPFVCYSPQQAGPMAIRPGTAHVTRRRLVVADGPPDAARAGLWRPTR